MIPGIDPKVDIAFKKVFGTQQWRNLTMSLIDAVLRPAPWEQLVDLELLNPYTEKMSIDHKLSILDIKARDNRGRLFNVEMQMVVGPALPQRFLYYWSNLYSQQLAQGDDYHRLCPTISICFVNGRLFPGEARYHRRFRLVDTDDQLVLTDQMEMHVLELPNFVRELGELHAPLDLWLYFLKNGEVLDADALPEPLATGEVHQAMEVLKMFSQDEMERELYQGRLKAKRDAQMWETLRKESLQRIAEYEQRLEETEQRRVESEQRRVESEQRRLESEQRWVESEQRLEELEQRRVESERRRVESEQRLGEIEDALKSTLVGQIQLCERLLGREVTDSRELEQRDEQALRALAQHLGRELTELP